MVSKQDYGVGLEGLIVLAAVGCFELCLPWHLRVPFRDSILGSPWPPKPAPPQVILGCRTEKPLSRHILHANSGGLEFGL